MKKVLLFALAALSLASCDRLLDSLINNEDDIVRGLKEALSVGTDTAVVRLSRSGGYLTDQTVKILIPEEAQTTFGAVRAIAKAPAVAVLQSAMKEAGVTLTSDFEGVLVTAFNEAAEKAAPKAAGIFKGAITRMSIADGEAILFSDDTIAATTYLRKTTEADLTAAFAPDISASMDKVGATDAWAIFAEQNNKLASIAQRDDVKLALAAASLLGPEAAEVRTAISSIKPVETSIGAYVTGKALNGLFTKVGAQEHKIRTDASARVSQLLQDVFGRLD